LRLCKALHNRKNSLFFKTENGAHVGDVFLSLIHTCQLAGENPFDYLTQVLSNTPEVAKAPDQWLPWNYRKSLKPKFHK
jgi:transposase